MLAQVDKAQVDTAPATHKAEMIQKLLDRVDALEREVAGLQQARSAAASQPVVIPQAAVTGQQASRNVEGVAADAAPPEAGSRFNFQGYADAGFQRDVDGVTKKFELGEIDVFGTERLSPRLTALMELSFETNSQQLVAQVPINVERLLLQYRGNDFFNAEIGAFRTAVGYYSTAYLRGAWLQTAVSRPNPRPRPRSRRRCRCPLVRWR